jgi:hypothetical protein
MEQKTIYTQFTRITVAVKYENVHISKYDANNTILDEDGCLLGCSAMESGRTLPTFQRSLLPPSVLTTWHYNPEDSKSY